METPAMTCTQGGQFDQEQVPEFAKVNAEPSWQNHYEALQGTTLGLRPKDNIETIHAASFSAVYLKNPRAIYGLPVGLPSGS